MPTFQVWKLRIGDDDQLAPRQLRAGRMQTQLKRQEQLAWRETKLSVKHESLLGPWTSIDEL